MAPSSHRDLEERRVGLDEWVHEIVKRSTLLADSRLAFFEFFGIRPSLVEAYERIVREEQGLEDEEEDYSMDQHENETKSTNPFD